MRKKLDTIPKVGVNFWCMKGLRFHTPFEKSYLRVV